MTAGVALTVYLTGALIAAIIATLVAPGKRRHPGYWLIASFLFPPAVLLLLVLPVGRGVYSRGDPYEDPNDDNILND